MYRQLINSIFLLSICMGTYSGFAQMSNADYTKGSININLPKTPESASFEKYGNIPVEGYSGVPDVSIPLFKVQSKFSEVPITLAYHPSGIKVSQEATWVGLGFDLVCGGRITVETKGTVDGIIYNMDFQNGAKRFFNKWGSPYGPYQNQPNNATKVGYAFLDYGKVYNRTDPYAHTGDTLWDANETIPICAWDGRGQPDIYHASFAGHSFSFYFSLEDNQIYFLGDRSNCKINPITNTYPGGSIIVGFTIVDEKGVSYLFDKQETTNFTLPVGGTNYFNTSSPSAWLLSKISKLGDEINFTYSNYGTIKPTVAWSQSITGHMPNPVNDPGNTTQNVITETPLYLTKLETSSSVVDFSLSTRLDLDGIGARKLDGITIRSKNDTAIVKQYKFTYDYFIASADPSDASLPDIKKKRLRLLSLSQTGPGSNPWKFFYNSQPGPNKYSFAQDHWGLFNGQPNSGLVPYMTDLVNQGLANRDLYLDYEPTTGNGCEVGPNQCFSQVIGNSIPNSFTGWATRTCDIEKCKVYTLDSIVYPTGGATKFIFEPHTSQLAARQINNFVGGGLRVKQIRNYADPSQLESITDYDYQSSGIYLGNIEYLKISPKWPYGNQFSLSSWGIQNYDAQTVGYGAVKKTIKNFLNEAKSGYTINYFVANTPLNPEYVYAPRPYCTYGPEPPNYLCYNTTPDNTFLYIDRSGNGPRPKMELDGKLYKEEVFDAQNNLLKRTDYYYRQLFKSFRPFSIRAEDNYLGQMYTIGVNQGCASGGCFDNGYGSATFPSHFVRWMVSLDPAISYFTALDSVITKTYVPTVGLVKNKQTFSYSPHMQQEFASNYNSDGTQSISYTKTPLSFTHPNVPSQGTGDSYQIEQMQTANIIDMPIEQIALKRNASGDTTVTGAVYNQYDQGLIQNSYRLETAKPLAFRTEFVPTYYYYSYPTLPSFYLTKDSKYKLEESAEYTNSHLINQLTNKKGVQSVIWDEDNNYIMASFANAAAAEVAYTSFETSAKGNWSYSGTPVVETSAPTGKKAYLLANGDISINGLSDQKTYVVSYWSKNGAQNVNGSTYITGRILGNFTYYEHRVVNPTSGRINVSGAGTIDELRVFPEGAQMAGFTYQPLTGIATKTGIGSDISYYQYDASGRLAVIRDQDKKILKQFCYNYAGQPQDCNICTDITPNWQNTTTPVQCQVDSNGYNTGYTIQEQMDMNSCSLSHNLTRWVVVGQDPNACPPPVLVNLTSTNTYNTPGYVAVYYNTASGHSYTFPVSTMSGLQPLGTVPAGNYTLTISRPVLGDVYSIFRSGCFRITSTGMNATFYNVPVSATGCISITVTINVEQ